MKLVAVEWQLFFPFPLQMTFMQVQSNDVMYIHHTSKTGLCQDEEVGWTETCVFSAEIVFLSIRKNLPLVRDSSETE